MTREESARKTVAAILATLALLLAYLAFSGVRCYEDEAIVIVIGNFEGNPYSFATGVENPLPAGYVSCAPWDNLAERSGEK